jgi:small subunit ribosomal protein S16
MVRIRLRRIGARHRPYYRIVVADQRSARNGKVIEEIGTYDPMVDPPAIKINEESAVKWLRNGAKPSEAVEHMLKTRGIMDKVAASA